MCVFAVRIRERRGRDEDEQEHFLNACLIYFLLPQKLESVCARERSGYALFLEPRKVTTHTYMCVFPIGPREARERDFQTKAKCLFHLQDQPIPFLLV